jgi:hypothetical protein
MEIVFLLGGLVLAFVGIVVGAAVIRGWVFSIMWSWFIVPLSPSIPSLSIPMAIGLALVVTMLTYQAQPKGREKTKEEKNGELLGVFVGPFITLFFAWLVHLWM